VLARRFAKILLLLLLLVMAGEFGVIYWRMHQPKESPYDPVIVAVAREDGVDPFLIRALIWRESRFRPEMLGTAQERGLMQVTPAVGEEWAKANKIPNFQPDDLYNPVVNIRAGTWCLNRALGRWSATDDPTTFALAEYNAGHTNALRWVDPASPSDHVAFLNNITFPGTRQYVETILSKRDEYQTTLAHNRWYRDEAQAVTLSR
jgi:soluble lytic murein transglycosylase